MKPKSPTPTPQELEIMKIVWRRGPVTVRDVYEALRAERQIAYTTVMTMMKILEEKGYLKKRRQERAYLYRAAERQDKVIRGMIREFVGRVFDGSAEPLLLHLVKDHRISRQELDRISRMIQDGTK
ncbi:MAG TPA: BlaI/MecI/CopY family transcriptional regulator [Terriglobia bacterium]|nr:BlaI/MecI/CopY family transcriptional regulator [Terriglobia bacterium]